MSYFVQYHYYSYHDLMHWFVSYHQYSYHDFVLCLVWYHQYSYHRTLHTAVVSIISISTKTLCTDL